MLCFQAIQRRPAFHQGLPASRHEACDLWLAVDV